MTTEELPARLRALQTPEGLLDVNGAPLGIAEVAERLGMSEHSIRYYERAGLVTPSRDAMGRRRFDTHSVRRLEFLRRMRCSGMGMADLERYIALVEAGPHTEPERLTMMLAHRDAVRERLGELELALAATEYKIAVYGGSLDGECSTSPHTGGEQHDDAS